MPDIVDRLTLDATILRAWAAHDPDEDVIHNAERAELLLEAARYIRDLRRDLSEAI